MQTKRGDVADNHMANQLLVVKERGVIAGNDVEDTGSPRRNHGHEARSCRWRAALGEEAMSFVAGKQGDDEKS